MMRSYRHIGGAHDLVVVADLLHPVGAPACYTRYRKDRSEQFDRKSQHVIDKAGVKIYVRADTFVYLALRHDDLRRDPFHRLIKAVFLFAALGMNHLLDETFEGKASL